MKTTCPHCGRLNNMHSTTDDSQPEPGNVSLCWKCGGIAIFTEDGVRLPTPEEKAEIEADPDVKQYRYAIAEALTPSQAVRMIRDSEN